MLIKGISNFTIFSTKIKVNEYLHSEDT